MSNVHQLPMNYKTKMPKESLWMTEQQSHNRLCELLDLEENLSDGDRDDYLLWEAEILCKQLTKESLEKLCETIREIL